VDHVVADLSEQRDRDVAALMNKHEQQIAELVNKHEAAVLELRAGHEMLMRSAVVGRRGDGDDVTMAMADSGGVVPTSSTDSIYMKTRPTAHWVCRLTTLSL